MRKFTLAMAAMTFLFASCSKEYTCVCSENVNGSSTVVNTSTIKGSKKNAESKCDQASSANYGGSGAPVTCKLSGE